MKGRYFIDFKKVPAEIKDGLLEIKKDGYPVVFSRSGAVKELYFSPVSNGDVEGGFDIIKGEKGIDINYNRITEAFRALGVLFGMNIKDEYRERTNFKMLGVMLDASRNGVLTVDNIKLLLRRFALMGINTLMLYTEDTYEVEGEPFFGYLRGRYTKEELKEVDAYAEKFGIEMFPCIQTLGHLQQMLQWSVYKNISDTNDILLVGKEETYKLLEKMITSASYPYRSKRIHIGMDEADMVGTGQYKKLYGERDKFEIMNEHLERVVDICRGLGLRPMIWDDMYFRLGSKTHHYYDLDVKISEEVVKNIPEDVDFVYWDYFHTDCDFYSKFIDIHRDVLGKEPIVAPGAWNWNRFWANMPFAYMTVEPCMKACRDKGIKEVFITAWGDNGMENDIYSVLPVVQFFTEMAYVGGIDRKALKEKFMGSCRTDIEYYERASSIDTIPITKKGEIPPNCSKWLLWNDTFIGLFEPWIEKQILGRKYEKLAGFLKKGIGKEALSKRLIFPYQISRVLAIKCEIRRKLVMAYRNKDKKKLNKLLDEEVKSLIKETRKLWIIHRDMWLDTYKPFGLEVIEKRYGGLIARLESLEDRIEKYIKGEIGSIPEFETELLQLEDDYRVWFYRTIATPSAIF
ncbi:MAG: beta-N-acetylhexosaminidase [bacterium]|nr:beta-N-acetylhexosaminidase [bacterium]